MQILITPEDIIRRCLFLEYKRFCLEKSGKKSEDELRKIIEENKPTVLNEEDAFVIGLLKVVDTPNLVHRFKFHMGEVLKDRSNIFNNKLFIIKSVALKEIGQFIQRFPNEYKAPFEYKKGIEEVKTFSAKVYSDVDKLPTSTFQNPGGDRTYTYISSNSVKDIVFPKKEKENKEDEEKI